jgi:hypothetical protein
MSRAVYRGLLWLHPSFFREQFAGEMLWIFDQAVGTEGAAALLADGLLSLIRQGLIRRMTWKIAAAVAGALLQVGLVAALTAGHAARRSSMTASISANAGSGTRDLPMQAGLETSSDVRSQNTTISAAAPVGGKGLPFAVLFGVVFVYAVQRRRPVAPRSPAARRRLGQHKTPAGQPGAGSKSPLSIVAD